MSRQSIVACFFAILFAMGALLLLFAFVAVDSDVGKAMEERRQQRHQERERKYWDQLKQGWKD